MEYIPSVYVKSYYEELNIIKLCLNNKIGSNLSNIINDFIKEINTGFKLFEDAKYIINGSIIHYNKGGHPFECALRIIAELNIVKDDCITYDVFRDVLDELNFSSSNTRINLNKCIGTLINHPNIKYALKKPCDYNDIFELINKDIVPINDLFLINKSIFKCSICENIKLVCIRHLNCFNFMNLNEYLIEGNKPQKLDSNCQICNINTVFDLITKIKANCNILHITINSFLNDYEYLKIDKHFTEKLDLPNNMFEDNISRKYKLNIVVMYTKTGYSVIINKNNKWYHYYKNNIYQLSFTNIYDRRFDIHALIYKLL